jgi:hypothetical protein
MKWLRYFCFFLPPIGILIAISCWLTGKEEHADDLLFVSFAGFCFFAVIFVPAALIVRAVFF